MAGLVINPIPPIYRESELGYILADCGSKLIFVPGTFRKCDHTAMVKGLRGQLPKLADVVTVRSDGPLRFEEIITGAPASDSDLPAIDPASVIIAMYTSGTTGRPKCVLHTHYTYGHRVNAMAVAYGMSEADVTFMPSPVTHITGAIWAFDMPWVAGNTSVLMDVWSPAKKACRLHRAARLHRIGRSDAVPPSRCSTLPKARTGAACVRCDCSSAAAPPSRPN